MGRWFHVCSSRMSRTANDSRRQPLAGTLCKELRKILRVQLCIWNVKREGAKHRLFGNKFTFYVSRIISIRLLRQSPEPAPHPMPGLVSRITNESLPSVGWTYAIHPLCAERP